jgi:hypothetical protein
MARPGATHRAAAPSCTRRPGTRAGRLHRDVHGRPAARRNPGLLDDSGLAPASRPWTARGPQAPADSPTIPAPGPRARRHPGVRPGFRPPCAVTLDQLHHQGDDPHAAGTTDGDASATRQSRKTLSAADEDVALATVTQVGNSPAISEKITSSYLSPADPRALAIRGAITYWRR